MDRRWLSGPGGCGQTTQDHPHPRTWRIHGKQKSSLPKGQNGKGTCVSFARSLPPVSFNLKRTKQKSVPRIAVAEALLEWKMKMSPRGEEAQGPHCCQSCTWTRGTSSSGMPGGALRPDWLWPLSQIPGRSLGVNLASPLSPSSSSSGFIKHTLNVLPSLSQASLAKPQESVLPGPALGEIIQLEKSKLYQSAKVVCWSVAKSCLTLGDPTNCSTPSFPVFLPELAQIHVHWVSNAIQPSHPLSPPFPLALSISYAATTTTPGLRADREQLHCKLMWLWLPAAGDTIIFIPCSLKLSHGQHFSFVLLLLHWSFPVNLVLCCAVLSCLSRVRLFATLWTVLHQTPLPLGFSRQEYWSGLSCPPPGDLPHPGIKPTSLMSPALAGASLPLTGSLRWVESPY